jgi:hypothetical protein
MTAATKHEPRGRLWDASTADYFADQDHWSNSAIKVFIDKGPRAAWAYIRGELPMVETRALRFGQLFHMAILERDEWALRLYPPQPERPAGADGRARKDTPEKEAFVAWKAACDEWRRGIRPDSIVPDDADRELLLTMQEAVIRAVAERAADGDSMLGDLLAAPGLTEQAVRWTCPWTGLPMRCRWDKAIMSAHTILDLKSTIHWQPDDWARRAAVPLGYHRQAWVYSDAYEAVYGVRPRFLFLVCHKNPLHEVALYELTDEAMEAGMNETRRAMERIARHYETGRWFSECERGVAPVQYPLHALMDAQLEGVEDA